MYKDVPLPNTWKLRFFVKKARSLRDTRMRGDFAVYFPVKAGWLVAIYVVKMSRIYMNAHWKVLLGYEANLPHWVQM